MRALLAVLLLSLPCATLAASAAGERVTERGTINDDYYGAGGVVDIDADINGDVIVAGGELLIGHRVTGDLIAAGGSLRIRGTYSDDIRVSGGELDIDARVGDDLVTSGGLIYLGEATTVGGDAWLVGGEVHVAGTISGNLKVIGGEIRLSGIVLGDVELEGGEIEILDSAQISSTFYQVCCKRVPESMRTDGFGDPCSRSIIFHQHEYHIPGEFPSPAIEKQDISIVFMRAGMRQTLTMQIEVRVMNRLFANGHQAFFVVFTQDTYDTNIKIQIGDL